MSSTSPTYPSDSIDSIQNINGKNYRIPKVDWNKANGKYTDSKKITNNNNEQNLVDEKPTSSFSSSSSSSSSNNNNTNNNQSKTFSQTLSDIPSEYFYSLLGKGDETKKKLELKSNCKIDIPSPKSGKDARIKITGSSMKKVMEAAELVRAKAQSLKFTAIRPTHFIALPLTFPSIISSYEELRSQLSSACKTVKGFEESMFVSPSKLHFTLFVLRLLTPEEISTATYILENFEKRWKEILTNPFTSSSSVELKGLETWGSTKQVSTLYVAPIKNDAYNAIYDLTSELASKFIDMSMLEPEAAVSLKLHCSVIRTVLGKGGRSKKKSLDLSHLWSQPGLKSKLVKNGSCGSVPWSNLSLSLLSMVDPVDKDGGYHCVKKI